MMRLVLIAFATVGSACFAAQANAPTPESGAKVLGRDRVVLSMKVERGDYIVIVRNTGVEGKDPKREVGFIPFRKAHIRKDNNTDNWVLQLAVGSVPESIAGPGKQAAWSDTYFTTDRYGKVFRRYHFAQWVERQPDSPGNEIKPLLAFEDLSASTGIAGLRVYKIPYAEVKGETHFFLVAVSKDHTVFRKVINIAKTYFMFDWNDNWTELYSTPAEEKPGNDQEGSKSQP